MNKIKKMRALMMAAWMIACVLMLSACIQNIDTATQAMSKTAVYRITVLGVDGQPVSDGVIVRFLKNGEEIALQKTDVSGVAAKELKRGDYTVEVMFINADSDYYYDTAAMTLTAVKTELTVELAYKAVKRENNLFVNNREYPVYEVQAGLTHIALQANDRSYFLFTPTESGVYRFSTVGERYIVGYYGGPHFVQLINAGEVEGNATCVTVSPGMIGTNVFVIGVDNSSHDAEAVLKVERISAYVDTAIPTQTYETTAVLAPWTLPENTILQPFDLTAPADAYKLVLDEATGFYHLGSVNGPLVLVCLGEASDHRLKYAASYDTILQTVGVSKYFKDADGNYTHQEDYSQCLVDYIGSRDHVTGSYAGGCVDRASGLYPLTADLMYIIRHHGDHSGWWDVEHGNYLFRDINGTYDLTINPDLAWLFMCVYVVG